MTEKLPSLRESLAALAGEPPSDHPALDRLLAYHHGELGAAQRDHLQGHLARCRDCARLLLDLRQPGRVPPHARQGSAWRSIRRSLGEAATGRQPPAAIHAHRQPPSSRLAWAAAAALLLVCLGLGVGYLRLERRLTDVRRQLGALSEPQLELPMAALYPVGFTRAAEDGETSLQVPPGAQLFTFTLNLSSGHDQRTCELEIRNSEGRTLWRGGPLEPTPFGNYFIALRRGFLPPGRFELRIYRAGETETPIARYRLRLEYE